MSLAIAKATDDPVTQRMDTATVTRAPATPPALVDFKAMATAAAKPILAARLETLIASVVEKLRRPEGASADDMEHSPDVYRADAISLLIAARKPAGPGASGADRMILKALRDAQKAAGN